MTNKDYGLLDNWLRNIRDVSRLHMDQLVAIKDRKERNKRLIELNVQEQCINLFKNGMVQNYQIKCILFLTCITLDGYPRIHGLVYDLKNGLLKKLDVDFKAYAEKYQSIYSLYDKTDMGLLLSRQVDFVKSTFNDDGQVMDADKFFTGMR
jgi:carbonic anhydrase